MEVFCSVISFDATTHRMASTYTDIVEADLNRIKRTFDIEPIQIDEARNKAHASRRRRVEPLFAQSDAAAMRAFKTGEAFSDTADAMRRIANDAIKAWIDDSSRTVAELMAVALQRQALPDSFPGWP